MIIMNKKKRINKKGSRQMESEDNDKVTWWGIFYSSWVTTSTIWPELSSTNIRNLFNLNRTPGSQYS